MDCIYRCVLNKGKIRIFLADCSDSCKTICEKHNLNFAASDCLSRVLSVGAVMGIMQKYGNLTIKIDSNGPLKGLLVDADCDGNIRGFVLNSNVNESLTCKEAIGDLGILTVIKDFGMKRTFSGQVELQSGGIGDDFSYYFNESEQVPSVVAVGSSIEDHRFYSGALIVQLMPGYKEEDTMYVEHFAKQCPKITDIIKIEDKKAALEELFPEIEILSTHEVHFKCNCSKERFINGLATISKDEIVDIINENKDIELKCQFCNEKYVLSIDDVKESLKIRESMEKEQC